MSSSVDIVKKLLANMRDDDVVRELVAPDATYVSLCYEDEPLKKIMPHAGQHSHGGPAAFSSTFRMVDRIWTTDNFQTLAVFGTGEDVAVFGDFTLRSRTLSKAHRSPFSIWFKVDEAKGQVTYMQFMEDTFGTAATFEVGGEKTYWVDNGADGGKEVRL